MINRAGDGCSLGPCVSSNDHPPTTLGGRSSMKGSSMDGLPLGRPFMEDLRTSNVQLPDAAGLECL